MLAIAICATAVPPTLAGVEGHRGMYEAAWPVIEKVMGWTAPAVESRGAAPQWMTDDSKGAPWEVVA